MTRRGEDGLSESSRLYMSGKYWMNVVSVNVVSVNVVSVWAEYCVLSTEGE